jgi:hypothetical protein
MKLRIPASVEMIFGGVEKIANSEGEGYSSHSTSLSVRMRRFESEAEQATARAITITDPLGFVAHDGAVSAKPRMTGLQRAQDL